MKNQNIPITRNFKSKIPIVDPDFTFYESIKKISLVNLPVHEPDPTSLPIPKSFRFLDDYLVDGWTHVHAPLIEVAAYGYKSKKPNRSLFPGPYIPWQYGKMKPIGDTMYSIFLKTICSVKQRIPEIKRISKIQNGYSYLNDYFPIIKKMELPPGEKWSYSHVECPPIDGVYFPLPTRFSFSNLDKKNLKEVMSLIKKNCIDFFRLFVSKKSVSKNEVHNLISFIRCIQYLYTPHVREAEVEVFEEILQNFKNKKIIAKNVPALLFEIDHAVSYLYKLRNKEIIFSGKYGMSWIDVIKLPIENLIETELADIDRVLREVRSFFSVGWAPILVHLSGTLAYNIDGTHRHYALLTVELLRRLKHGCNVPLQKLNLNSQRATEIISEFSWRYKKVGLSLRETLRTVNYIVNGKKIWPYLQFAEEEIDKIIDLELQYIPVIYLPEWRARTVVKNLSDEGTALVGVPPINIEIVGSSNGKKGIFIRGGYHGDDRQPNPWFNIIYMQKYYAHI